MRDARDTATADRTPKAGAGEGAAERPRAALAYDRSGGGTVSVRGFRLLVALTLVNTLLLASMVLGPQLSPFVRKQVQSWKDARANRQRLLADLAAQQKCQTDAAPATKVVYAEDPEEVVKLAAGSVGGYEALGGGRSDAPPGWVSPVRAVVPEHYRRFLDAASGRAVGGGAPLFLHERSNPAGQKFLVAVSLYAQSGFERRMPDRDPDAMGDITFAQIKERTLVADVWPLGAAGPSVDARRKGRQVRLRVALPDQDRRVVARLKPGASLETPPAIDYGNRLRVFAGQADVKDPSHFTIAYELDGRAGTIDGWVRSSGLELRLREGGPGYDASRGEEWRLPGAGPARGGE
jgi:hypothetical protein